MRVPFEVTRVYQGTSEPYMLDLDDIKAVGVARNPLEAVIWRHNGGYVVVAGTYGAISDRIKEACDGN